MVIIFILNMLFRMVLAWLLFSLLSSTFNFALVKYRLVAISIIDGFLMSIIEVFTFPTLGEILIDLALFSSSLVVLYYPTNYKKFLLLEAVMLAYILLGWGVSYLAQIIFFNIFKISMVNYFIYVCIESLVVLLLGLIIYCFFRVSYKKKQIMEFVFDVFLKFGGKNLKLKMLLDSGNSLYDDNLTGYPIFIVSKSSLEDGLAGTIDLSCCRRVNYMTLNGYSASLPVFTPDKVELDINGNKKDVQALIGIVEKDFKLYDGLLHSSVI